MKDKKLDELLDITDDFHKDFAIIAKRHLSRVGNEKEREYMRTMMQDKTSLFSPWVYDITIGVEQEPEGLFTKRPNENEQPAFDLLKSIITDGCHDDGVSCCYFCGGEYKGDNTYVHAESCVFIKAAALVAGKKSGVTT